MNTRQKRRGNIVLEKAAKLKKGYHSELEATVNKICDNGLEIWVTGNEVHYEVFGQRQLNVPHNDYLTIFVIKGQHHHRFSAQTSK